MSCDFPGSFGVDGHIILHIIFYVNITIKTVLVVRRVKRACYENLRPMDALKICLLHHLARSPHEFIAFSRSTLSRSDFPRIQNEGGQGRIVSQAISSSRTWSSLSCWVETSGTNLLSSWILYTTYCLRPSPNKKIDRLARHRF